MLHEREGVGQGLVRVDGDGVHHHAGFVSLDEANLLGLGVRLEIAVNDADAAVLRHGDRHLGLGHRVHRGGDDGKREADGLGQLGGDVDVAGQNLGATGPQQDVIECEAFDELIENAGHGQLLEQGVNGSRSCRDLRLARVRSTRLSVSQSISASRQSPKTSPAWRETRDCADLVCNFRAMTLIPQSHATFAPPSPDHRHRPVHGEHGFHRDRDVVADDRAGYRRRPHRAEARHHLLSRRPCDLHPDFGLDGRSVRRRRRSSRRRSAVFMAGSLACACRQFARRLRRSRASSRAWAGP